MSTEDVSLSAALIAGLLSFFSPCVLPLVPIYLGYMTGTTVSGSEATRLGTLAHGAFFVLGFSLVFVLLGAGAGLVGNLLYPIMPYIVRVGGLVLIVFGLHMTGLITIPFLAMEKRLELGHSRSKNYWTSFLVGLVFAAGWTPCIGPVLSAILLLAADSKTATAGGALLAIYALGLGAPFLLVAGLLDVLAPVLKRINRYAHIISVVGGSLLMLMGILLLLGFYESFVIWLNTLGASG